MIQKTKIAKARMKKYSLDLSRYYRKSSTKMSLSVVLSVIIVAFFLLVAIRPTLIIITKLNREVKESEKTLIQLQAKAEALDQASHVWETIQLALPYVKTSIPTMGVEYNKLSKSIEVIAVESGVSITGLTIGKTLLFSQTLDVFTGKNQDVVTTPFTIRVVGGFPQTLKFLESTLSMDRLIEVTSVTINREVEGDNSTVVGLALSGKVQYLANPNLLNKAIDVGVK